MLAMTTATDVWTAWLPAEPQGFWRELVRQLAVTAEVRRAKADYNTGSILEEEAYRLLMIVKHLQAKVVIEVGTFVGLSTTAMALASCVTELYTCDASNDCLPNDRVIHTYPKQTSTQMFQALIKQGVTADLVFLDGTLTQVDAQTLKMLIHAGTVIAVHDHNYGPKIRMKRGQVVQEIVPRKGVGNVRLLKHYLKHHVLVEPQEGTTLALLVPKSRL